MERMLSRPSGRMTGMTIPAGVPGHGNGTTSIRAQPVLIRDVLGQGREWDGQVTGAYEVICHACGDNADLNYPEVAPEIQRIRGPHASIESAQDALMEHIGLRP
jgi:hypothetical protein